MILVGERMAASPGALTAVADAGGRRPAPGSAGCRGARASAARSRSGALPGLLPGGRPLDRAEARVDVAAAWGVDVAALGGGPRHRRRCSRPLRRGDLSALVVGGVEVDDLPDPALGPHALGRGRFLVSLEVRESDVTELADVVLPVAPIAERAGTFVNWEGRVRPFERVLASQALHRRAGAVRDRGRAGPAARVLDDRSGARAT